MKHEISQAIAQGKSDDQVLNQLVAAYGSEILLTSAFQGFNTLLWIVPVAVGLVATFLTVQRSRRSPK